MDPTISRDIFELQQKVENTNYVSYDDTDIMLIA